MFTTGCEPADAWDIVSKMEMEGNLSLPSIQDRLSAPPEGHTDPVKRMILMQEILVEMGVTG
ncbi:hypothetical protein RJ53_09080 [Methanocalculus chunghsingensis]|uniref:Uncharacterized protein n=1 Tax=Methanocalculus chunghsingensis TaxID=156457 RepID=A0A8J8B5C2_9EURY|nr:hypothetical protein [Methanocalculus chunghsingensis]MBR1369626.1 hypothetical protein [Methanocalculus chunghsingensis]